MKLEQKYLALIQEAQQRKMPDVDGIKLTVAVAKNCHAFLEDLIH